MLGAHHDGGEDENKVEKNKNILLVQKRMEDWINKI